MTGAARSRLSLVIALLGMLALLTLMQSAQPDPAAQALFLFLLFVSTSAAAGVLARSFHRRLASREGRERDLWRAEREGLLFGAWLTVVAWLRIRRTLDWGSLLLLAGVVVLIELAFVIRRAS